VLGHWGRVGRGTRLRGMGGCVTELEGGGVPWGAVVVGLWGPWGDLWGSWLSLYVTGHVGLTEGVGCPRGLRISWLPERRYRVGWR